MYTTPQVMSGYLYLPESDMIEGWMLPDGRYHKYKILFFTIFCFVIHFSSM